MKPRLQDDGFTVSILKETAQLFLTWVGKREDSPEVLPEIGLNKKMTARFFCLILIVGAALTSGCRRASSVAFILPENPRGFFRICEDAVGLNLSQNQAGFFECAFSNGRELRVKSTRPLKLIGEIQVRTSSGLAFAYDPIDTAVKLGITTNAARFYRLGADSNGCLYYFAGTPEEYLSIAHSDWGREFDKNFK